MRLILALRPFPVERDRSQSRVQVVVGERRRGDLVAGNVQFLEEIDGQFEGVGLQLDPLAPELTVLSPLYGSPAAEAGIRAGDKILRINDESTEGFTFEDAVKRLRGKVGQSVTLEVLHSGEEDPVPIEVVREVTA